MGAGMASNLAKKGWPLTVMAHRNRAGVEALLALGASEAATPRALAARSDIVVLCVTGSPQVEAVLGGPGGLLAAGKPLMVIDCSTSNPAITTRLAGELAAKGITLIDAPLSRTPKDAMEGTLDVMAGRRDGCRPREARAGGVCRPGDPHRPDRQPPHHEAAQQFCVDGLCRDPFGDADARRQGRPAAHDLRQRGAGWPHGLRLLPDFLSNT